MTNLLLLQIRWLEAPASELRLRKILPEFFCLKTLRTQKIYFLHGAPMGERVIGDSGRITQRGSRRSRENLGRINYGGSAMKDHPGRITQRGSPRDDPGDLGKIQGG